MTEEIPKPPSQLVVSTMTIIVKIANANDMTVDIDLDAFTRFSPVYESSHESIQTKRGGFIGLAYSSIIPRGTYKLKRLKEEVNYKKSPFYNQATLVYEYWGCRYVNIMMFHNCIFKMAGAMSQEEAIIIGGNILEFLSEIKPIIISNLAELDLLTFHSYAILLDQENKANEYYVRDFYGFFKKQTLFKDLLDIEVWVNKSGWVSGTDIQAFIDFIKVCTTAVEDQFHIVKQQFTELAEIKDRPLTSNEQDLQKQLLIEKNKIHTKSNNLRLAIIWMEEMRSKDLSIMQKYGIPNAPQFINVEGMKISKIQTEMINSDFSANYAINNTKLQTVLNTRYHIFPSYEPNGYPGLKIKYFWHEAQTPEFRHLGKCPHAVNCITKGKRSLCIQLTISVFQSGRIIITAGKSIEQIDDAYKCIVHILRDNYQAIKRGKNIEEMKKLYENPANEMRKLMKKKKLYYIERSKIIYPQ